DEVKAEIVEEFLAAFDIDPRDARKHFLNGLQTQIKGKRTVESMRTACRVYQTTQQAMIIKSRASIERFVAKFGADLVMDRRELELKPVDAVEAELVRRIEAKKAADELAKSQAEAAAAKAEADKAKAELAEANKPPAPPVNSPEESAPWSNDAPSKVVPMNAAPSSSGESEAQEWATFRGAVMALFASLKPSKDALKHPANIERAALFAQGVNEAWKSTKMEVAK
ncbi:MAG TPA: hypothetical protein VF258_04865, partial [Luteolibacter sp.]